jgi:anti-sigma factor RsiW
MKLNCRDVEMFLDVLIDGELEMPTIIELKRHIQSCADCDSQYGARLAIRSSIRTGSLSYVAPHSLRKRVEGVIRSSGEQKRAQRPRWSIPVWLGVAASAAIVAIVAIRTIPPPQGQLKTEVIDSHVRSMMANHLVDVASTDQHTVKPWFSTQLDFSPPVGDFNEAGFHLIGGRLDYIDHHTVAALVYRRNQHVVNVLIWPARETAATGQRSFERGFFVVRTNHAGLDYWIVGDLNADELTKLANLLTSQNAE